MTLKAADAKAPTARTALRTGCATEVRDTDVRDAEVPDAAVRDADVRADVPGGAVAVAVVMYP